MGSGLFCCCCCWQIRPTPSGSIKWSRYQKLPAGLWKILTWLAIPGQDNRLSGELLVMWGILEEGQHFKYED